MGTSVDVNCTLRLKWQWELVLCMKITISTYCRFHDWYATSRFRTKQTIKSFVPWLPYETTKSVQLICSLLCLFTPLSLSPSLSILWYEPIYKHTRPRARTHEHTQHPYTHTYVRTYITYRIFYRWYSFHLPVLLIRSSSWICQCNFPTTTGLFFVNSKVYSVTFRLSLLDLLTYRITKIYFLLYGI